MHTMQRYISYGNYSFFFVVAIHPCFKNELFLAEKYMTGHFSEMFVIFEQCWVFLPVKNGCLNMEGGDRPTPLLQAPSGLVKFHIL